MQRASCVHLYLTLAVLLGCVIECMIHGLLENLTNPVRLQTVLASAKGKDKMPSSFSMDCWSLGAIGFGVLARYNRWTEQNCRLSFCWSAVSHIIFLYLQSTRMDR